LGDCNSKPFLATGPQLEKKV